MLPSGGSLTSLAKAADPAAIFDAQSNSTTSHLLVLADGRELGWLPAETVHLVLTSPPYWKIKNYGYDPAQLGSIGDYHEFLRQLGRVWRECYRVLVPGGRLICVVGDICLPRRTAGRHYVVPFHADLQVEFRRVGFDNLTPILWHKITNGSHEVENGIHFYGKPYEPNAVIKNETEFVLMQRKPGGYRKPTQNQRVKSLIPKAVFAEWFSQVWKIPGEAHKDHPAPFPQALARRLIRMYSFCGDTVLDPFVGTATTIVAAMQCGRNSIGVEINQPFFEAAKQRARAARANQCRNCDFRAIKSIAGAKSAVETAWLQPIAKDAPLENA